MKRLACVFLSIVLSCSLFPVAAIADNAQGPVTAAAYQAPETPDALATSGLAPQSSAASSDVADVSHVVSQTLGTVPRTVPAARDFRAEFGVTNGYPQYNANFDKTLSDAGADVEAQKAAVLAEDEAVLDYTSLDAQGNLYKNGVRKAAGSRSVASLVRHTAGVAHYGEQIPDSAPATNKRLSIRMVRYGNVVTGLYAPPGEVVKVTLNSSSSDTEPQNLGLKAFIGNYGGNAEHVEIPGTRNYVRMPKMDKSLDLDAADGVNYIGSPFGGAILIYSNGIGGTTVDLTIEGAVEMPTYFYGETSDEELTRQLQAPGPYFAFSTPRGLRAVGPASLVRGLTADQVRRAMEFWDKAIGLSYQFEAGSFDSSNPDTNLMVEMFEPYIPAGAAVNMGNYCICPVDWGNGFLNADGLIRDGAWGQIHELNHSFPWGGAIDGMTEISNNVINALTYQLYTNIAATRKEPTDRNDPSSGGLTGWNWCTDLYTTMERIRLNTGPEYRYPQYNLQVYIPVQHAFGADRFIDAVHRYHALGGRYNSKLSGNALYTNSNVWMRAASEASGYNLGYLMRDVLDFPEYAAEQPDKTDYITTDVREALADTGPLYIPSGCLYASGFVYDAKSDGSTTTGDVSVTTSAGKTKSSTFAQGKEIVEMGRPLRIPCGQEKVLNFHASTEGGSVSVARGEQVELVGYTAPRHGQLSPVASDSQKLAYTPNPSNLEDSFYVSLKLTVTDQSSPYVGQSQFVTYKIALLQETGGFTTSFYSCDTSRYTWGTAAQRENALADLIDDGVFDSEPYAIASSDVAGFDAGSGSFAAVTEGKVFIGKTGEVDLYVRGSSYFSTYVSASQDGIPSDHRALIAGAQSKRSWPTYNNATGYDTTAASSCIKAYVTPAGGTLSDFNRAKYDVVINEGDPLYVKAYLVAQNAAGRFRIGYLDGGEVREFASDKVWKTQANVNEPTPPVTSFTREKLYSYQDPAVQSTELFSAFEEVQGIQAIEAWQLDGDTRTKLAAYANTPVGNITDDSLATHFHGHTNGPYVAEFIFRLPSSSTFNTIRYKGHADFVDRGKIRDYEVYVGDDLDQLKAADARSDLLKAAGTANRANDYGDFNRIDLGRSVSGRYIRLVARNAYPSNGQYYYALADFRVGSLQSIGGEGTIEETYSTSGNWMVDDAFVNTRTDLMTTSDGVGTFTFTGSGVIMYAATGPAYGTMAVTLDGDGSSAEEVVLTDSKLRGQQPVFWRSGLSADVQHTLTFRPKKAGVDRINVEYFEVKSAADAGQGGTSEPRPKTFALQLASSRYSYTGSDITPSVVALLDGEDVTSECEITYADNRNVGNATVTATLRYGEDEAYADTASFEIVRASYDGEFSVSLKGGNRIHYGHATPELMAQGAPAGASVTCYYGDTWPEYLGNLEASSGLDGDETGQQPAGGVGAVWDASVMAQTVLAPGRYYVWAIASSPNYFTVASDPVVLTVFAEHDWRMPTYTWATDYSRVKASAVCSYDARHTVTQTVSTTYAVTKQPTATAQGTGTYTATFATDAGEPFTTQVKTVSIPAVKASVTVDLNANGGLFGSGRNDDTMRSATVYSGSPYGVLPAPIRQGFVFDGWYTAQNGGTLVSSNTVVTATGRHELFAHWTPTATVEGAVQKEAVTGKVISNTEPVQSATVALVRGNTVVGQPTKTDEDGVYILPEIPYGVYNLVVDAVVDGETKTVTKLIEVNGSVVRGDVLSVEPVVLPSRSTNSKLVVDGDAPDLVVGGLDGFAERVHSAIEEDVQETGADTAVSSVTVVMNVIGKGEWEADGASGIRNLAEKAVAGKKVGIDFFDVTLASSVTTYTADGHSDSVKTTEITDTTSALMMAFPFSFSGRSNVAVYRCHDGITETMGKLGSMPSSLGAAADCTYFPDVSNDMMYVFSSKFSTYAVGYVDVIDNVVSAPEKKPAASTQDNVPAASKPSATGAIAASASSPVPSAKTKAAATAKVVKKPVYRLYNAWSNEHLFTISKREMRLLVKKFGWAREGVAWRTPKSSSKPVYRLFNKKTKSHFYTASKKEKKALAKNKKMWCYEGVSWYAGGKGGKPVYRVYDPMRMMHHYTVNKSEVKMLVKHFGWKSEGVAWRTA